MFLKRSAWVKAYGGVYRLLAWGMSRSSLLDNLVRPIADRADRFMRRRWRSELSFPNPIRFEGYEFFWEAKSYTVQGMFYGTYEADSIRTFRNIIQPGMNIVDVGGHIGCYSILAAAGVGPEGRVFTFEPHPETACLLARNVAINGYEDRVEVVRMAVGGTDGWGRLCLDESDDGSSRLVAGDDRNDRVYPVQITTLDSYFRGEKWPNIDLIKMDIEGSETGALGGMLELSHRNPCLKLIIEFNPEAIGAADVSLGAYYRALADCGFTTLSLIQNKPREVRFPVDVPLLQQMAHRMPLNLLCVKERAG